MFYKPISGRNGIPFADAAAEIPALVSLFPITEASGSTLTCAITGALYTLSFGSSTWNGDGSVTIGINTTQTFSAGSIPNLTAGKSYTLLTAATFSAAGAAATYGDFLGSTGPYISLSKSTTHTDAWAGDPTNNGTIQFTGVSGSQTMYALEMSLVNSGALVGATSTLQPTPTTIATAPVMNWNASHQLEIQAVTNMQFLALVETSAPLGDDFWRTCCAWMVNNGIKTGTKEFYPGLADLR